MKQRLGVALILLALAAAGWRGWSDGAAQQAFASLWSLCAPSN